MTRPKVTAREMLAALYRHFDGRWAMLTEVTARPKPRPVGTPFHLVPRQRDRRIDVLLVRPGKRVKPPTLNPLYRPPASAAEAAPGLFPAPASGPQTEAAPVCGDCPSIERLAIEVKVSRGDFLSDVRTPEKQAPWRELAHRHAYAVPAGLVRAEEVPAESGLIEVKFGEHGDRPVVSFTRRCPRSAHEPGPLPFPNIMDAFYRTARMEADAKGYGYQRQETADDPETLRIEVKRLRHELDLATEREGRLRERVQEWQKRWAAHEPPPCGTCGQPLHIPRKASGRIGVGWEHRDPADAGACLLLRTAAAVAERDSLPEGDIGHRLSLWVRDPEPADPAAEAAA
ncbi:hypothetical protein ABZY58_11925 [Micromonospora tulbaghiae]|uniref:hypothetical protein n=1 Tax=Micromonospora tulbaghiae TaxID=479978 RepID=UPI0033BDD2CD